MLSNISCPSGDWGFLPLGRSLCSSKRWRLGGAPAGESHAARGLLGGWWKLPTLGFWEDEKQEFQGGLQKLQGSQDNFVLQTWCWLRICSCFHPYHDLNWSFSGGLEKSTGNNFWLCSSLSLYFGSCLHICLARFRWLDRAEEFPRCIVFNFYSKVSSSWARPLLCHACANSVMCWLVTVLPFLPIPFWILNS